ncbi:hypothetical protein [Glutamicibacter sp. TV12E]|uniref:hypothetical protein n=1 Tax=Glutamicibacter sp. TV12E TaxID=3446362 RepID=UPI0040343397
MSHFKLLVIGENIEEQLAPYDENLTVEPHVDPDWDYLSDLKHARKFYAEHPERLPKKPNGDAHTLFTINDLALLRDYNEGEDIREENRKYVRYTTYNPKSKWDYWTIGGRYSGTFRIKDGANAEDYTASAGHWSDEFQTDKPNYAGRADAARKRAIDFDAMETHARAEGLKNWLTLQEATEGITPPQRDWAATLAAHKDDANAAREEWHSHPWNKAANDARLWDAYELFHMGADDPMQSYLEERVAFARGGFYAVVQNGEWQAQGKMGWFGFSNDEFESGDWYKQVAQIISDLPHGTLLTVVDCHI